MIEVNYLSILIAGAGAMVVGFIWYGFLFKKTWMQISGVRTDMTLDEIKKIQKRMGGVYLLQFILSVWTAYVLFFYIKGWSDVSAVTNGFWIWLGFVMPTIAGGAMWSGKPRPLAWKMFFVSAGAQLVTFIVFALIIGAF